MFVLERIKAYSKTDRIALVNRGERLTFARLDARSEAFAAYLLDQFGDDRTPVVICGDKETDFLPCIFGALKSGRAYVPVDGSVPRERAAEIASDVRPKLIIDFTGLKPDADARVLTGGALDSILSTPPETEVPRGCWISGDTPAYILFTSGSTGKPKGVPITAANLTNFYRGLLPYMGSSDGGVILNQISYSFDVSGCSLYVGLSRGMTLFTIDRGMAEDVGTLFAHLQDAGLTIWVSTPSFAELCVHSEAFCEALLPSLHSFLFCGEVLTHGLCETLAERFPGARVLNTYGPTEATVLVTAVEITEELRRDSRSLPIGYPLEEVTLRLVDDQNREITRDGERGQLIILSDSVGPGYHRRADLTEERFFTDRRTGKRGYRTGDICCREKGRYYYCGRTDSQLKLNGFRIEVEDIENNLAKLPNIARAAVVPVWEDGRVRYLAAFLLLKESDGLTHLKRSIQLKQRAAAYLPAYMIPRKLIAVDAFPLNVNGKIDKKALGRRLREAKKV